MDLAHIRNFSIIAHIDHGKSTLADRILEVTGALTDREKVDQFLDKMDLERERGITIKAQSVRLPYRASNGELYQFNLIDTPGHVDFSYEVSRSLSACEGAVLVVDAAQGVEAQTVANAYLAVDNNLAIVPVLNKIDLPIADPVKVQKEIEEIIGIDATDAVYASAKEGTGIQEVLEQVVEKIPPPKGDPEAPLKALIFDRWFDSYQGVVTLVRVYDGVIKSGMKIKMVSSGKVFEVQKLGVFSPHPQKVEQFSAGEAGFMIAGIREVRDTRIGDTVTDVDRPTEEPLPGFREVKPMVYSGLYPIDSNQYGALRDAMGKLRLNDSSFTYESETSTALGFGFRCGFLGLLHMEIIQERLEREYDLDLITTAPTVDYQVVTPQGKRIDVQNPADLPSVQEIENIEEPYILASIHVPSSYVGSVIQLCVKRRGIQKGMRYLSQERVLLTYEIPLSEVVFDFYDRLKSVSKGYASLDYEFLDYRPSNLVRLDLIINGELVDALSSIVHKDKGYERGRVLAEKIKEEIPRQMFEVAIQAAIGNHVIARATKPAMRKNVTAKCYGGDVTRKRKLLEKQKEGKKRMKRIGKVEIPQAAFLAVLKKDD